MANAEGSNEDKVFITEMEGELAKLKGRLQDQVKDQLAADGNLQALATKFEDKQAKLEEQVKNLKQSGQTITSNVRKKLRGDLDLLEQGVTTLGERLESATDAEWPPPTVGAWLVFICGIVLLGFVFMCYVNLHTDRPLRVFLKGISVQDRVDLATKMSTIKTRAQELSALPAPAQGQEAETAATVLTLQAAMLDDLEAANAQFKKAAFSPAMLDSFNEHYQKIRTELTAKTPDDKVILEHVDQVVEHILKEEEPFFWETGAGRYVEVLFGSFFGIMTFALYNWWKFMRRPVRAYYLAWHVAKIILSLVASVIIVAVLSQVNFATPTSLKDQTAIGLGTASMDIVVAFSMLSGYFSHLVVDYLEAYATRIFKLA
jgi:hypothetical protein